MSKKHKCPPGLFPGECIACGGPPLPKILDYQDDPTPPRDGAQSGTCPRCSSPMQPVTSRTPEGAWQCLRCEGAQSGAEGEYSGSELAAWRDGFRYATEACQKDIDALRAEVKRQKQHAATMDLDRRTAVKRAEKAELIAEARLTNGAHTCHEECEREACVLRREVERLKARFGYIAMMDRAVDCECCDLLDDFIKNEALSTPASGGGKGN